MIRTALTGLHISLRASTDSIAVQAPLSLVQWYLRLCELYYSQNVSEEA